MDTIMTIENFSFQYQGEDKKILKNISFSINQGEVIGIVGENGSGKSTLCKCLVGLIPHYISGEVSGGIWLNDKKISELTMGELSTRVGLVFQNPFNQLTYTTNTVREELAFGLGNLGVSKCEILERVEKIAKLVRISDILDNDPVLLSGGQVQRVALGSCLIMEPEIMVLDECCSQLDPIGSEEVFTIIQEMKKDGKTIIIVEHDMERICRVADKILVLKDGEILDFNTPEEVFSNELVRGYITPPDYTLMGEYLKSLGEKIDKTILLEEEIINKIQNYKGRIK